MTLSIHLHPHQELDLITRARIAHLRFPDAIIGGWAAARYRGIDIESRDAPLTLYRTSRHNSPQPNIFFREIPPTTPTTFPDPVFPSLPIAAPHDAAIDCLALLEKDHHTWWVPKIHGLTPKMIRQVQLLDAFRSKSLINEKSLETAAKHRFNGNRLGTLIHLSSKGADSPRESLLRLILRDVCDWETQVTLLGPNGKEISSADLANVRYRVAVFYDGEHHLQREQRDYDSKVWALLTQMGWRTFRVTSGMLSDPEWIIAHTEQLLAEAKAEQASKSSRMIMARKRA